MNKTSFSTEKNKLFVTRTFNAPLALVWRAWTEAELLDKWWAPRPWQSVTTEMDFKENGLRVYYMAGPEGEKHWCRTNYKTVDMHRHFTGADAFADESGNINEAMPVGLFSVQFNADSNQTEVTNITEYPSEADLQKVIEMGMKEGLSMAFQNLDEVLAGISA
jgi:uncharacterized protein YndB with AHSA1/START domain